MVRKKWPCGHVEKVLIPNYQDRVEATFYGPDVDDEPPTCPRCKRDADIALAAKTSAEALRIADKENTELQRRIRRLKQHARSRESHDARVDKLIDIVTTLVAAR